MTLTQDEITKRLLQARKLGETPDWATIGKDPDTAGNPFQAQLDTGETNVVYATVVGNPDPQIIYYDPSCDLRLLQYGARVELEWRNGKAWVKGADKEYLTQQQAGTPLPTGNMPLADHDHVTKGGTLGTDSVGTSQITDLAVTTGKINALAVTTAKIADANVTNAKLATNAVDTTNILDDAVTPTKTDGLTGASAAIVTQTASDTFSSIDYTLSANTRLYYDGTDIKSALRASNNTGAGFTTAGTAVYGLYVPGDIGAAGFDTSAGQAIFFVTFSFSGSTVGDVFDFSLQYNYDNGGAEAWQDYFSVLQETIMVANYVTSRTFQWTFSADAITTPTWGYSGTNNIRIITTRSGGTGTMTVPAYTAGHRSRLFMEI